MPLQVDAVYENNGVLRAAAARSSLAVKYIERIKREVEDAKPAPGLAEVRRRLTKIPGSMAAEIIAERGDR